MTWTPPLPLDHVTTTERLSGRTYDGSPTYVKLVKQSGVVSTGNFDVAHGITGLQRIVYIYGGAHVADGTEIPIPNSGTSLTTGVAVRGFGTTNNIRFSVGTSWTSTLELSDIWFVIEYLK